VFQGRKRSYDAFKRRKANYKQIRKAIKFTQRLKCESALAQRTECPESDLAQGSGPESRSDLAQGTEHLESDLAQGSECPESATQGSKHPKPWSSKTYFDPSIHKPIEGFACKFTMHPSEFSPLPVGVVQSDHESDHEIEYSTPKPKKVKIDDHEADITSTAKALLQDAIVIPVQEEPPALNSGNLEIDCQYSTDKHCSTREE